MGKPEDYVEKYLMKQCKRRDFGCLKFVSPGTNGVPDRIIIANGRIVFVETKRAGGKLRRLQEEITAEMRRQGADVRVADTRELVDEILAEIEANPAPRPRPHTPDITGLLRKDLADQLPDATPEQIDELTATAKQLGASLNADAGSDASENLHRTIQHQKSVIDRVRALAERWKTVPALRRGAAARELQEALAPADGS